MLTQYFLALVFTSITSLLIALFVYLNGPRKLTDVTYALYTICIAWWSLFEALAITTESPAWALNLWRLSHVGVILIPVFFVHFAKAIRLNYNAKKERLVISLSYLVAVSFLVVNFFPVFIQGVTPKFSFKSFIIPGHLYLLFFVTWTAWIAYGLTILIREFIRSTGERRNQLKHFCWSMLIAYIGGVPNFFPTFNIEIPILMPFGTYAIPIYTLVTAYAISRYRLMEIGLAITRFVIFVGIISLFVGLPMLIITSSISYNSIAPFTVAVIFMTMGAFVLLQSFHSATNRIFALNCLTTVFWQGTWTVLFSTSDPKVADILVRVGYSGIIFIPFTFYHFVVKFTNLKREEFLVKFSYIVGGIFLILLWTTDLFISGKLPHDWGYYPRAGVLHPLYILFLSGAAGRIFVILLQKLKKEKDALTPLQKNHVRYILLSIVAYTFASVDFLVNYGVAIYPFGFLFTLISASIVVYAIAKYHLLDISVLAARSSIFITVYAAVLGLPFWVGLQIGRKFWFIPVVMMAIFASAGPFIYNYLRSRAEDVLLKEQRRYQRALLQVSKGMMLVKDLNKLIRLIVHVVARALKIRNVTLFLLDKDANRYFIKAVRYSNQMDSKLSLDDDDVIVQYLRTEKMPIVLGELKSRLHSNSIKNQSSIMSIERMMEEYKMAVIVPSFVQELLIGFLVLGEKSNGKVYTQDDLNVFKVLANQSALAIENAMFYQETGKTMAEKFQEHRVWSIGKMGAGIGHQMNNRLNNIKVTAEVVLEDYLPEIKKLLPDDGGEVMGEIEAALRRVSEDAQRGGEVAKILNTFSKKSDKDKLELTPIDIQDAIKGALDLLSCKLKITELGVYTDIPTERLKVMGNLSTLQDVFFNMLDNTHDALIRKQNAIRECILSYVGPFEPKTTIRARVLANNQWEIEVEDNGIGMTEEDSKQLFIPFFTKKATSEKGTGLGLGIIKQMIEAHGGTIRVTSKYGEGTKFIFTLQAAK